jgi:TPR repeat protein
VPITTGSLLTNYGLRLENGEGVAKDLRLAAESHKKAVD